MGKDNQPPKRAEIQAKDLPERLKEAKGNGELVYILHDTDVLGDLDLRHSTVEVAVDIQHCDFYGAVDLRDCEFKQSVELSHCTFHQEFNSGDEVASHTVFKKNLVCNKTHFVKAARFQGVQCESSALFRSACFQCKQESADFSDAKVEKSLICDDAAFCGGVSLNAVRCGVSGSFKSAQFEHKEKWIEFTAASFKYLDCSEALFNGPTSFNGVECTFNAEFVGARFEHTKFEVAPRADFSMPPADFTAASFKYVDCSGATFKGPVSFFHIECAGDARFQNAKFLRERSAEFDSNFSDFSFAEFGSNLDLYHACFEGPVTLEQARVSKRLVLTEAELQDGVSLYGTTIGSLVFSGLRGYPNSPPSFAEQPSLDLRKCTFGWFQGNKEQAREFAERQSPATFSRDAYVQLEKYYNISGDESEAKKIYREGREKAREHARMVIRERTKRGERKKEDRGKTELEDIEKVRDETEQEEDNHLRWSFGRYTSDFILGWLTGYGVQTWRLFLVALVFVLAGFLFFLPKAALVEVEASGSSSPSGKLVASTGSGGDQSSYSPGERIWDRTTYSLDLFLPVVKLGVDERWEPNGFRPQAYAFVHQFVGWLLVPLLLASLAGIIKRQS
jgi:uncharacterized protein YjbI with pentapeptide repeats